MVLLAIYEAMISKVNFKPVTFMKDDFELLFNVLDISFIRQNRNIDIDKYSCLIDLLSNHQLTVVRHIILQPPARGTYEAVKTTILNKSNISDAE